MLNKGYNLPFLRKFFRDKKKETITNFDFQIWHISKHAWKPHQKSMWKFFRVYGLFKFPYIEMSILYLFYVLDDQDARKRNRVLSNSTNIPKQWSYFWLFKCILGPVHEYLVKLYLRRIFHWIAFILDGHWFYSR